MRRTIARVAMVALMIAPAAARIPVAGAAVSAEMNESYGRVPLAFEPNRGQMRSGVAFLARGAGYALQLAPTELTLGLRKPTGAAERVRMRLLRSNPRPIIGGRNELPGRVNYFVGRDPAAWRSDIPTYARVEYEQVYPGVDLVVYGNQRQLEYDLVVAPGADPDAILLAIKGARRLDIGDDGALILRTAGGDIRQGVPRVYQDVDGTRRSIAGRYVLHGHNRVGFAVAAYDRGRPLVIDPTLTYSTYLGGTMLDQALGIAVDTTGAAYVTGYTLSTDFPTRAATLSTSLGSEEIFIAKLNPGGTALVYSTYIGGSGSDSGNGIAVDQDGAAYVTGSTDVSGFPSTSFVGVAGGLAAFVVKLEPGGGFGYSLLFGGEGDDIGNAIAVDGSGRVYVAGATIGSNSFATFFPSTKVVGPAGGGERAFVGKVDASGTGFDYLLRFGGTGTGTDQAFGLTVDAGGTAYVAGYTGTPDFPRTNTIGPLGGGDVFVAKVNQTGTLLPYSVVFGGTQTEAGRSIAIDGGGAAYVTGDTLSTDFPTVGLVVRGTGEEAFVAKLDSAGTTLVSSTYLGGNGSDAGSGIAVDAGGSIYVAGSTDSTDFPTVQPIQPTGGNAADAFVTKLGSNGTDILFSTYLGSPAFDAASGIALDAAGALYVTGAASNTAEAPFPTTAGAIQPNFAGQFDFDAFVSKITFATSTQPCTLPNQPYTKLVFTSTSGVASPLCGGPHLSSPSPANPISGTVDDGAGLQIGKLGLGCYYLGAGASEAGGVPTVGAAGPEMTTTLGAACSGTSIDLFGDAGSGPADCSKGMGPGKHCIGGAHDGTSCAVNADCPGGTCEVDANCFFGTPVGLVAAGVPVCIVPVVAADAAGTLDPTIGQATVALPLAARVYVTTIAKPCPLCASGFCDSGARAGLVCGSTLQCLPSGPSISTAFVTPILSTDETMKEHPLGTLCPGQVDSSGAFGKPAARRVIENGTPAGDLTDKSSHAARLGAVLCFPGTGSPAADTSLDLPGPVAVAIPGTMRLLPGTTTSTVTSTVTTSTSPMSTTSTSTTATTTPPTATTSSSTSAPTPSSTPTSTVTTSTSIAGSSSTTTALVSSTTSTTTGPICGDGHVDPGEVCDDGNLRDNDCCISGCKVVLRRGTLCGDPALGECDGGDSCDSDGHCLPNPKPAGTPCSDDGEPCTSDACDGAGSCSHTPGNAGTLCHEASDPCDVDAFCDGATPACPLDTSGCTGDVKPPQGKTIEVDCTAQDSVQGKASTCQAVGFQATTAAGALIAASAVLGPDAGEGSRVTTRATRKLKTALGPQGVAVRKAVFKLKLNRLGRALLKHQSVLNVSVHVEIRHGTSVRVTKRIVQILR